MLAAGLSRVLFPIVLVLGLTGIVTGILNSYDHFTVPALSPIAWNLVILLGLGLGVENSHAQSTRLYWYAVRDPRRDDRSVPLCRCRGCAAATTGCGWRSTSTTRR